MQFPALGYRGAGGRKGIDAAGGDVGGAADHLVGAAAVLHLHHGEAVGVGMGVHPVGPGHHHPGKVRVYRVNAFHLEARQGQPFGQLCRGHREVDKIFQPI